MPKITELPDAASLDGTEAVPVVQGGATRKTTLGALVGDVAQPFVDQAKIYRDEADLFAQALLNIVPGVIYTPDNGGIAQALIDTADGETFVFVDGARSYIYRNDAGSEVLMFEDATTAGLLAMLSATTGAGQIGMVDGRTVEQALAQQPDRTFDDLARLAASDAGELRRSLMAAEVQALRSCLLNINGNQRISQEVGTVEQTGIGAASPGQQKWITDGHKLWVQGSVRVKAQQVAVTDLPGFQYALRVEVTTAQASIGSDFVRLVTFCEASDFIPLAWGTLKAKDMILYAWVKTNVAGTYEVNVLNGDRTVAVPGIITVDQPNEWQFVRVHFRAPVYASDWTVGGLGYRLEISLAGGTSPDFAAQALQYFEVTGLAVMAADYDPGLIDTAPLMPSLRDNIRACERYFLKSYNLSSPVATVTSSGQVTDITDVSSSFQTFSQIRFSGAMAGIPAVTLYSPVTGATGKGYDINAAADIDLTVEGQGSKGFNVYTNSVAVAALHTISFHYIADARIG